MTGKSIIGRFGSGREVRRIEDAELLAGMAGSLTTFRCPSRPTALPAFDACPCPHRLDRCQSGAGDAGGDRGPDRRRTGRGGGEATSARADVQRPDGSPGASPLRPALAEDTVRFVGEGIVAWMLRP